MSFDLRTWVARAIGALALVVALASMAASARAQEAPSWLEATGTPGNWNVAGMAVPLAPVVPVLNPRCAESARWPEGPADQAVADAGWGLFGTYQGGWGVLLIQGTAGFDGMCRPLGYETFVFVDGVFAGTTSPEPMDSRSTGAQTNVALRGRALSAAFLRYATADPLCCPSRPSVAVDYALQDTPDGPLLVPLRQAELPR